MSDKSPIEWTDASWNPVTGCSKVSPGCANCYAEALTMRYADSWKVPRLPWTPANAAENVRLHPERLGLPHTWKAPRRVFVNSMSDLFHELVPDDYVMKVFEIMAATPRHTYQVLTKRPERLTPFVCKQAFDPITSWLDWPLPNVWLGTSIENDRWTVRADHLRTAPAAVRFLSCEPLLGPLPSLDLTGIDWVIVGGESGPGHRPMDPDWVRDIRDRCEATGAAFFFKQWGGATPKSGGRELDGRTWDGFPGGPA